MEIGRIGTIYMKDGSSWELRVQSSYLEIRSKLEADGTRDYVGHTPRNVAQLFNELGVGNYKAWLREIYGYTPGSGTWPTWYGDTDTVSDQLFKAMQELASGTHNTGLTTKEEEICILLI